MHILRYCISKHVHVITKVLHIFQKAFRIEKRRPIRVKMDNQSFSYCEAIHCILSEQKWSASFWIWRQEKILSLSILRLDISSIATSLLITLLCNISKNLDFKPDPNFKFDSRNLHCSLTIYRCWFKTKYITDASGRKNDWIKTSLQQFCLLSRMSFSHKIGIYLRQLRYQQSVLFFCGKCQRFVIQHLLVRVSMLSAF